MAVSMTVTEGFGGCYIKREVQSYSIMIFDEHDEFIYAFR